MTHFKYTFIFPEVKYPFKCNVQLCSVNLSQEHTHLFCRCPSSICCDLAVRFIFEEQSRVTQEPLVCSLGGRTETSAIRDPRSQAFW